MLTQVAFDEILSVEPLAAHVAGVSVFAGAAGRTLSTIVIIGIRVLIVVIVPIGNLIVLLSIIVINQRGLYVFVVRCQIAVGALQLEVLSVRQGCVVIVVHTRWTVDALVLVRIWRFFMLSAAGDWIRGRTRP